MCDVDEEAVVSAPDAPSIYDIPKVLHTEGLDAYVVRRLGLPFRDVDWSDWDELLRRVHRPARSVTIALVGKYVDLPDAYLSPAEALRAGGFANDARVNIRWVTSDDCQTPEGAARAARATWTGSCVPGGFGVRGIEGKLGAIRYARENSIPLLGLCLGLQCMAIEVARDVAGLAGANSSEFDPDTPYPVIATMADQQDVVAGRAGHGRHHAAGPVSRPCWPRASWCASCTATDMVRRAAPAPLRGQQRLPGRAGAGRADLLRPVAGRPAGRVRRAVPASVHPFFVATQAHPEFLSRPTRPHPLFAGLVGRGAGAGRVGSAVGSAARRPAGRGQRMTWRGSLAARARRPEDPAPLRDVPESWPVLSSVVQARGQIVTLRSDQVQMPDHEVADRQVVEHPGAVVIVALDEAGQVLMIRQYRHPVGRTCSGSCPAGPAGRRAGSRCGPPPRGNCSRRPATGPATGGSWPTSTPRPGISTERIRVFLARDLARGPGGAARLRARGTRRPSCRSAGSRLDEALAGVLAGDLHNGVYRGGYLVRVCRSEQRLRRPAAR